jgi:hypothetical protein
LSDNNVINGNSQKISKFINGKKYRVFYRRGVYAYGNILSDDNKFTFSNIRLGGDLSLTEWGQGNKPIRTLAYKKDILSSDVFFEENDLIDYSSENLVAFTFVVSGYQTPAVLFKLYLFKDDDSRLPVLRYTYINEYYTNKKAVVEFDVPVGSYRMVVKTDNNHVHEHNITAEKNGKNKALIDLSIPSKTEK